MKNLFRVAVCALSLSSLPAATLIHDYQFQNSLNDSLGGPSLVSYGGTLSSSGYTFGANQGLSLTSGQPDPTSYSIALQFSFSDLSGYRKIIDYKNLASDNGLYNLNQNLVYYPFAFGATTPLTANTLADVVLTRDSGTNIVDGYVNGVVQFSFTDSSNDAVTDSNDILNFFDDDSVTGRREASGGFVDRIQIYDGALTAAQVAALDLTRNTGAPEPASLGLIGIALCAGLIIRKRLCQ